MNPSKKYPKASYSVAAAMAAITAIAVMGFGTWYTIKGTIGAVRDFRRATVTSHKYGTVEKPDYLITAAYEADPNSASWIVTPEFTSWRMMEEVRETIRERAEEFSSINVNIDSIENIFDERGGQAAYDAMQPGLSARIDELYLGNMELGLMEDKRVDKFLEQLVVENYLAKAKFDINEQELTKKVFSNLTGKEFPKNVRIVKEDIFGETITAYYSAVQGRIAYEDLLPVSNVLDIFHELGHMAAQHGEYRTKQSASEIDTLEEACAYAMVNAGLNDMKSNEKLKEFAFGVDYIFRIHLGGLCRDYYNGIDDKWHHGAGAALCVAASIVFNDPYKTYNHLATLQNSSLESLDPKITQQMKRNSVAFEGDVLSDLDKMNAELEKNLGRIG